MAKKELQNVWIALRASGLSYRRIAKRIGVSTRTQMKWAAKLDDKVESVKGKELEFISEHLRLAKKHRLERLSGQLDRLENELDKRDISDMPTAGLIKTYESLMKTVSNEIETIPSNAPEIDESMLQYFGIISKCMEFDGEQN